MKDIRKNCQGKFVIVLFLIISYFLNACSRPNLDDKKEVSKTVMVYMSANNNLASEAYDNINQMESGYSDIDGNLLVYAKVFGQNPKIYEIIHDDSPKIVSHVLKDYPDHNASDPIIMKMVFEDMERLGKAKNYAAILWSHATNWYPGNKKKAKVKSFGDDDGQTMDVLDLKKALPKNLDYLVFDACSMGSVEVLYELKDIVPYVLASPTEVISVGLPYDKILTHFFDKNIKRGLMGAAQVYFDFYNKQNGLLRSASYSLIDMKEMLDLARVMGEIIHKQTKMEVSRDRVQRLDLDVSVTNSVPAFDLLDFCEKNYPKQDVDLIKRQVEKTVLFKVATPSFLGSPIHSFSGLSCYIPSDSETEFGKYYQRLGWNSASSYFKLFHWIS